MKPILKSLIVSTAALAMVLASCNSGINNIIGGASGGKGFARLVDASPNTVGPLALVVAATTINSGVTTSTPFGVYASVGAGPQSFTITPTSIPGVNKSITPSVSYTVVVLGEQGQPNYGEFIFQDTNALQSPGTVRFKVDDAAPLVGTIDVYIYQGATLPATPTVAALTVGTDSGSIPSPPGDSYIPPQGSPTILPSGAYNVTVTAAGSPGTVLFTSVANLSVNNSYSFIVEDSPAAVPTQAKVILGIDQPPQSTNQASLMTLVRKP